MGGQRRPQESRASKLPVNEKAVVRLIQQDEPELLDEIAVALGKNLVEFNLKASQIRNVFGTVRKIQANWTKPRGDERPETTSKRGAARRELVLLKPKLFYTAARNPEVEPLKDWLVVAINAVLAEDDLVEYQRFTHFMDFFEAVLAYHTALGGKQS